MAYKKGEEVFPEALLKEIQKYISGGLVYIPQKKSNKKDWGSCSGLKMELVSRNAEIKRQFREGAKLGDLAEQYFLSVETIKKIVYQSQ